MSRTLPLNVLEVEHVEAEVTREAALVAHEEHELLFAGDECVHRPAIE